MPETRCDDVRETLRPLPRRAARRIHWRDEEEQATAVIVTRIAALRIQSLVVVGAMINESIQEPILWLPDAVAGAAGDQRCGRNDVYGDLSDLVEHIELGPV